MKSELTIEIENHLVKKFGVGSVRWGLEVPVKNDEARHGSNLGYVDFLTVETNKHNFGAYIPFVTCYEIKVSFSDFKSLNGHNFIGDENYYVMPLELFEEILEKDSSLLNPERVGIYVYKNGRMYLKREIHNFFKRNKLSIEERFAIMDNLLVKWIRK